MIARAVAIAAVALLVLLYLRSPIDLVPDVAGAFGFLDDLVVIGLAIWWARRRLREAPSFRSRSAPGGARSSASASAAGDEPWDPWRVLGIEPGASREEIARAYRAQVKLYHPDRVADLGEELRALAHRKALDLRRAYEELAGDRT